MSHLIFVPAESPLDWKRLLSKPDLHWQEGRSAKLLADSWHSAEGFPQEVGSAVESSFGTGTEVLVCLPEFPIPLPGGSRPSRTDLFVLARHARGLLALTVEAKVDEPFGPTVESRLVNASPGLEKRVSYLAAQLQLSLADLADMRYQLLHRTVAALLCARRFNASDALVLVQSFSDLHAGWADFQLFCERVGCRPERGAFRKAAPWAEPNLWFGWVACTPGAANEKDSPLKDFVKTRASRIGRRSVALAGAAFQKGRMVVSKATDEFSEFHEDVIDRLMPECTVPAVLLPIGPRPEDFTCIFDFHDAVEALRRGRLIRPRIEAWAGRPDLDRQRLSAVLRDQFAEQFRAQKLSLANAADLGSLQLRRVEQLEKTRDDAGARLETAFKVTATAIGAVLLVANPLADLLFLTIALFGGSSAVGGLFQQLRASSDLRAAEGALEKSREEVERNLDVSSARFKEAVNNITIHIHPTLQRILSAICDLEGYPFAESQPEADAPEVADILVSNEYVAALDPSYRPFLAVSG